MSNVDFDPAAFTTPPVSSTLTGDEDAAADTAFVLRRMLTAYYDQSLPHGVTHPSTGATAGIPGTWTPAGSGPPKSVGDLLAGKPKPVTASPTTAWTTGQYVQTGTAGAPGRATWTGTAWVGGAAPLAAKNGGKNGKPTTQEQPVTDETTTDTDPQPQPPVQPGQPVQPDQPQPDQPQPQPETQPDQEPPPAQ